LTCFGRRPVTSAAYEYAARACVELQRDVETTEPGSARLSVVPLAKTRLAAPAAELAARTGREPPEPAAARIYIDYLQGQAAALGLVDSSLADVSTTVADQLQQGMIEMLGRAWPACSFHGRHPMIAADFAAHRETMGNWHCPLEMGRLVRMGELREPTAPEVEVPYGTVRWWLPMRGWGMVADADGDIMIMSFFLEDGLQDLAEGDRVDCTVETHRAPSGYRQALSVRRPRHG